MSMKASSRRVDRVTVVDLSGRIKEGEDITVLRDTIEDLLGKGQKNILLNLSDINHIDSSGAGALLRAFTSVRDQGGELKLLHPTKNVRDMLQNTKLSTVFEVRDDEATAIAAFGS